MTAEGGDRAFGEIIAVGTRPAGGGRIELVDPPTPGEPTMRWASTAHTIDDIEKELARIWAQPDLVVPGDDERGERGGRHIAARTSVMNLVVIARRPEIGERSAETISRLTGRHPSRTLIVLSADPDGPPWLDARIQAHCVLPRAGCARDLLRADLPHRGRRDRPAPVRAGRAAAHPRPAGHGVVAGRAAARLGARGRAARDDGPPGGGRIVVDAAMGSRGSRSWRGCSTATTRLSIRDFALVRQARWREAIAGDLRRPRVPPLPRGTCGGCP